MRIRLRIRPRTADPGEMELVVPFVILALVAFPFAIDQLNHEIRRQQVCAAAREFGAILTESFLTEPCSRCEQREMGLLWVGVGARSIHYECRHCHQGLHAAAVLPDAFAARYQLFQTRLASFNRRYRKRRIDVAIVFETPEARRPID
jgi:hypothetical protein